MKRFRQVSATRGRGIFILAACGLICAGCSGANSPTSATSRTDYGGTWTGRARIQECIVGSCGGLAIATGIRIQLNAVRGTVSDVEGTIAFETAEIRVTGRVEADGFLSLTGQGVDSRFNTVRITQWRSRDIDGVMTGAFTHTLDVNGQTFVTVTRTLEDVVKPGVVPPLIIPDIRFTLRVHEISVSRIVPCCGRPVVTTYSGCYGIQNHTPLEATVEFTLTPIGVDGRDYSDVEHVPDRSTVSSRGTLSGCGGGLARDFNVSRPIAAQYRLRVDYTYPDGFTGSAEGVAPVKIVRDELAPR